MEQSSHQTRYEFKNHPDNPLGLESSIFIGGYEKPLITTSFGKKAHNRKQNFPRPGFYHPEVEATLKKIYSRGNTVHLPIFVLESQFPNATLDEYFQLLDLENTDLEEIIAKTQKISFPGKQSTWHILSNHQRKSLPFDINSVPDFNHPNLISKNQYCPVYFQLLALGLGFSVFSMDIFKGYFNQAENLDEVLKTAKNQLYLTETESKTFRQECQNALRYFFNNDVVNSLRSVFNLKQDDINAFLTKISDELIRLFYKDTYISAQNKVQEISLFTPHGHILRDDSYMQRLDFSIYQFIIENTLIYLTNLKQIIAQSEKSKYFDFQEIESICGEMVNSLLSKVFKELNELDIIQPQFIEQFKSLHFNELDEVLSKFNVTLENNPKFAVFWVKYNIIKDLLSKIKSIFDDLRSNSSNWDNRPSKMQSQGIMSRSDYYAMFPSNAAILGKSNPRRNWQIRKNLN